MSLLSSVLKIATTLIPQHKVSFRKYLTAAISEFGVVNQQFSEWVKSSGVVQPGIVSSFGGSNIELKDYKELGLDWSRRHITVWLTDKGLEPCCSKDGADQIKYDNRIFTILQVENWDNFNNWQRCYCVEEKERA